ncbi:MAG: TrkH family potassium uptake protein [Planctomycetota bacterium]
MSFSLVSKYLGIVALLTGASMGLCLPWAFPVCSETPRPEWHAVCALLLAMATASILGAVLLLVGRRGGGRMFRKEALAVVGLSWCLATALGAVPYLLSGTCRAVAPAADSGDSPVPIGMGVVDAIFESASGFSGTGATVITDLENPDLVPRAILFWRSTTHFLGGLGIMVLFVALLGYSSSGKAVMRAELAGPNKDTGQPRVQQAARVFAGTYITLNVVLVALLLTEGLHLFDALCHSFGTIATGGFSTYNDSVGHFQNATIEMTIVLFMAISCINFALLYHAFFLRPGMLLRDAEARMYIGVLIAASLLAIGFGLYYEDFESVSDAVRYGLFQVTSILTNTGFGTHNFDQWNEFGRGLLFLLMFIGGCAGSTSCSLKAIRHLILAKLLSRELERTYRPNVVRPLWLNGKPLDSDIARQVIIYCAGFLVIAVTAWLLLLVVEPDATWNARDTNAHEKLMDCASAVAATMNGVGPGLGTIGTTRNYAHFNDVSKLLLSFLMLLGRLEIIPIIVLLTPRFWSSIK